AEPRRGLPRLLSAAPRFSNSTGVPDLWACFGRRDVHIVFESDDGPATIADRPLIDANIFDTALFQFGNAQTQWRDGSLDLFDQYLANGFHHCFIAWRQAHFFLSARVKNCFVCRRS